MSLSITRYVDRSAGPLFLKSAFADQGTFSDLERTIEWAKQHKRATHVSINKTTFSALREWNYDEVHGFLEHSSGKFFTIDGIHVRTNWGTISEWEQPIINQPEIGFLGFITREIDDVLHFLVQAKIEPGNANCIQLSPTLQATRSNYCQVHKGKKPLYLDYFLNARSDQILLDQLQSEQGARFLKKRNRNIIIRCDEDIPVYDNFIWLTLAQIKRLIHVDNLVNMDTRTVISGISFGSYGRDVIGLLKVLISQKPIAAFQKKLLESTLFTEGSLHTFEEIMTFLSRLKSQYDLYITRKPLRSLQRWVCDDVEIYHEERKYFKVIAVDVEIGTREVKAWSQPMIEPVQEGLCAFVVREIGGLLHFAVQAKLECGNHDVIELAPTVQCLTGNYRLARTRLPFLDYVLNAKSDQVVYDCMQSEEGGRFFRETNRNMIVIAGDDVPIDLPANFIWLTLNQMQTLLKFNNFLNIQARSLISALSFV